VAQSLKNDDVLEETKDRIVEIFKKHLLNQSIQIKVESFKNGKIPAIINVEEGMRRMSELNFYYGIDDDSSKYTTLVLNLTNPIISGLSTQGDEKQKFIVNQIYYLATIAYRKLSPEELSDFVAKTSELLFDYSKLN
jgi:molecular chaperone HtpG